MLRLLALLLLSFVTLLSCNDNGPNPEEKRMAANGLFATGDTVNITTSALLVNPTDGKYYILRANGDTFWTVVTLRDKIGTYTYKETTIDTFTKKYIPTTVPPVVVPPVTEPPATGYSLAYDNYYEQSSDINTNQLGTGKQTVFEGRGVFWSEYKAGSAAISSGYRSEQEYNTRYFPEANPVEGKLSVEMYFKDYKAQGWGGHSLQWHPNNNNSAIFLLYHTEGKFNFARSIDGANYYQSGTGLKSIEANKWYTVQVEFKWSSGSDGYLRAYVDGLLCMSYTGKTQDSSGKPYLKVGQNFFTNKFGGIVLYDNLKIYKKS